MSHFAISTTYRDDSLHVAKRSNTHSNSHCSYFFILSHDSTKLLYLKASYKAVFLGIKAHVGKGNVSMAFAAAYLSIFKNTVFHAKGYFCFLAVIYVNCHATGAHRCNCLFLPAIILWASYGSM